MRLTRRLFVMACETPVVHSSASPVPARVRTLSAATAAARGRGVAAVVFDMDGTITHPNAIDFVAMRRRIGAPDGHGILEYIASRPAEEQGPLLTIVEEEERFGLARTRLKDDIHECFRGLRDLGVPIALLTRNNEEAVEHLVALLGDDPFAVRLSRSFEPCKPHPAPLHHIAEQLGLTADNLLMVGDSIDDVQCASAAGSLGCLVGCPDSNPAFERALPVADLVAKTLTDVLTLVRTWRSDA